MTTFFSRGKFIAEHDGDIEKNYSGTHVFDSIKHSSLGECVCERGYVNVCVSVWIYLKYNLHPTPYQYMKI